MDDDLDVKVLAGAVLHPETCEFEVVTFVVAAVDAYGLTVFDEGGMVAGMLVEKVGSFGRPEVARDSRVAVVVVDSLADIGMVFEDEVGIGVLMTLVDLGIDLNDERKRKNLRFIGVRKSISRKINFKVH